jgi:sialic acid synthase SpsE
MVVEKHLTYNRLAEGPDHSASADPGEFRCYVHALRLAERMRGLPGKRVLPCEHDVRRVSRQSLVLKRNVRGGEVLREADLMTQRPGTGIPAEAIERVVGRRLLWTMRAGDMLTWEAVGIGCGSGRQAG